MKRSLMLALFLLVAAAQLYAPLSQIWTYEQILKTGRLYKFRTAPVDPSDAFRGRYVSLNFQGTWAPVKKGDKLDYRQHACVRLEEGPDGFVQFKELSLAPPKEADYVKVECTWGNPPTMNFTLPFDRYYMEESSAPKAEEAYREFGNRRNQTTDQTYVLVRISAGKAVIQDLCIKDQPIRSFLKEQRN